MNRAALIQYILAWIKANGQKNITAVVLADVLVKMAVNLLNSTDDIVQVVNTSTRVTKPGTIIQDQEDQYAFTVAGWEWEIEGVAYAQTSSQNFQIVPVDEEEFRNDLFILPKSNSVQVVQGDVMEIPQPQSLFHTKDDIVITAISIRATGVIFDNAANTHKQNTDSSLADGLVTASELRAFLDAGRYTDQEAVAAIYNAWVDDPAGIQLVFDEQAQTLKAFLPQNVVKSVNGTAPDENGDVTVAAGEGGTSEPAVSAIRTVASNPAITGLETDLPYDCTAGEMTVSLAALAKRNGRSVTFYKVDDVNNLKLTGVGYGATTDTLSNKNDRATYKCDGANWLPK